MTINQEAIDNFMGSLRGLSLEDAEANMMLDARLYNWDIGTVGVIAAKLDVIAAENYGPTLNYLRLNCVDFLDPPTNNSFDKLLGKVANYCVSVSEFGTTIYSDEQKRTFGEYLKQVVEVSKRYPYRIDRIVFLTRDGGDYCSESGWNNQLDENEEMLVEIAQELGESLAKAKVST